VPKPERGRIVRVEIPDPQGANPKRRPVVIVDCSSQPFVGVAITGTFQQSDKASFVALPWQAQGRTETRLKKPCVTMCGWLVQFDESQIVEYMGFVPPGPFKEILQKIPT
jgi:hypothetical protein